MHHKSSCVAGLWANAQACARVAWPFTARPPFGLRLTLCRIALYAEAPKSHPGAHRKCPLSGKPGGCCAVSALKRVQGTM
jgi:hypothetical protein